ncbi:MAG: AMP-binding protein [Crocinitomicaceae bacterium]
MSSILSATSHISEKVQQSLVELIVYVSEKSPFYKQKYANLTLNINDLDLYEYKKIPFTTKEDLAANDLNFLCVPKNEIAEYVTTSGTTGNPISLYLTQQDLERLAKNESDSFQLMGLDSTDLFQLLTTIDKQFMAGLAYSLGVQKLGAGMIRIGPGVPELQWDSILKYEPTVLIAVPSFIVNLLEFAKENNIDFTQTSVKSIVCIGEPIRNEDFTYNILGKRITETWKVDLYSTYASTEMGAAFSECTAHEGNHLNEELLFLEVIKEDGTEANDQESGEIVVTTLGATGSPLVRYKTGDIAKVYRTICKCGRTSPRLGPILGRKNQMIKFKGTTIYPKAIFEMLDQFVEISCYKIIVGKDELNNDEITILLEDKIESTSVFLSILDQCKSKLRVVPKFEFLESNTLRSMVYKKNLRKPEKIKFI